MATVDGIDAATAQPIKDNAVKLFWINSGTGEVGYQKHDGSIHIAAGGDIIGLDGPTGPQGTATNTDVDTVKSRYEFGAWQSLPLATGWSNWGTGYATARYRKNDFTVELSGLVKWTGALTTSGNVTLVSTGGIASEYRPLQDKVLGGIRAGTGSDTPRINQADVRVAPSGYMRLLVFSDGIALDPASNWLSLDGLSYPLV